MINEADLKEFQNNLKKVSDFTHEELVKAMEVAQALVVNEARSDHPVFPKGLKEHPLDRYYTRTSRLTNSIRSGEVEANKERVIGEVLAGEGTLTPYAEYVESIYPFLEPALDEKKEEILQIFAEAVKRVIK